jgi:hypothetical protein
MCSSATLSETYPALPHMGLNMDHCGEKIVANQLSYDLAD